MWYFTWLLGLGFAVLLAVMNAMWGEFEQDRENSREDDKEGPEVEYE
ncbi:cytochrome bd-I oxidase subunit CydX [Cardiobacteriaceae bacterium TAE3-ERU3]|nr:cytochrome bd-I oxidase subunit CydX [Cardiobacteriaceae bacterium TAE3-ERU3]